jgi:hypothetical protein
MIFFSNQAKELLQRKTADFLGFLANKLEKILRPSEFPGPSAPQGPKEAAEQIDPPSAHTHKVGSSI